MSQTIRQTEIIRTYNTEFDTRSLSQSRVMAHPHHKDAQADAQRFIKQFDRNGSNGIEEHCMNEIL